MGEDSPGCLQSIIELLFGRAKPKELPYYGKKHFLSRGELVFYKTLKSVLGVKAEIMCHVRMADVIQVKPGTKNFYRYFGRIQSRHLDFVVVKPGTLEIIIAIELDDKSHKSEKAIQADKFKDEAFKVAKIPLLRVKAKKEYKGEELKRQMIEAVKNNQNSEVKTKR